MVSAGQRSLRTLEAMDNLLTRLREAEQIVAGEMLASIEGSIRAQKSIILDAGGYDLIQAHRALGIALDERKAFTADARSDALSPTRQSPSACIFVYYSDHSKSDRPAAHDAADAPLVIAVVSARAAAATALIAELDEEIERRYPGQPVHGIDVAAFERDGGIFAVGTVAGRPVACGALRPFGAAFEIKRMFVVPEMRGHGHARAMLGFLEGEAARRGVPRLVLETGSRQPEAIALYATSGWTRIPAFGAYAGPFSRCFEKQLARTD